MKTKKAKVNMQAIIFFNSMNIANTKIYSWISVYYVCTNTLPQYLPQSAYVAS